MAWVTVNKNGDEHIFHNKPERDRNWWIDEIYGLFDKQKGKLIHHHNSNIPLPKGSIKKLIGRELTWEDEPVELTEND